MKIPIDKRWHMLIGAIVAFFIIAVVCIPAACLWGRQAFITSLFVPFLAVVVAADGKEVLDLKDPAHHTSDIWDAVATTVGGLLILVPALVIALLKGRT